MNGRFQITYAIVSISAILCYNIIIMKFFRCKKIKCAIIIHGRLSEEYSFSLRCNKVIRFEFIQSEFLKFKINVLFLHNNYYNLLMSLNDEHLENTLKGVEHSNYIQLFFSFVVRFLLLSSFFYYNISFIYYYFRAIIGRLYFLR